VTAYRQSIADERTVAGLPFVLNDQI